MFGKINKSKEFRYDLMEVLMVNLPLDVPVKEDVPTLGGMLKTLLTPKLPTETIIERLEKVYNIPMDDDEKGKVEQMCNLGEGILERGLQQGLQQGIEQGIQAYVELCIEQKITKDDAIIRIRNKFLLDDDKAREYANEYYDR